MVVITQPFALTASVQANNFSVRNGQIISPSNAVYKARGINVYEEDQSTVIASSNGFPLLQKFPRLNFVRLVCRSNYYPATYYQQAINWLTAMSIVVELEHHVGAGGGVAPLSGSDLTAENNWFGAMASAFKSNPYVWFGTLNEPSGPGATLTAEQVSNYNTIRNAGNNSPVLFQVLGDYPTGTYQIGAGHGLTTASYSTMTNVMWDVHYYNYLSGYSTDQQTNTNLVANYVSQAQTITSRDGVMPVIIGEYGISTNDSTLDAGGTQACIAAQSNPSGSAAWNWRSGGSYDLLTDGSGNLTSYGQQVAGWISTA